MSRNYFFIILAVAIFVLGLFATGLSSTKGVALKSEDKDSIERGGWIEIVSGKTFLVENNEGVELMKELTTGDVVAPGNVLETDSNGKASVHFFDGSVLRINSSTRFTIKNAEYDKDSGKLYLKAHLSFGKIWSKIIELSTPDSLWQVETSNTVATVRGSAFGISSDGRNSEIYGSQHKVIVEVFDPVTKEKLKIQPIVVDEGNSLKISEIDVQKIKDVKESIMETSELVLAPVKIDKGVKSDEWFNGNENEDKKIDEEIKKVKEEIKNDGIEFKKAFSKKAEERFVEITNQKEDSTIKEIENIENDIKDNMIPTDNKAGTSEMEKDLTEKDELVRKGEVVKKVEPQIILKQNSVKLPEKWSSLKIETKSRLDELFEGEQVAFRAILQSDSGISKDVTDEVKWEIVGQIGSINKHGVFSALLDPLISELGEGKGFVVVKWEDSLGDILLGKSELIRIVPKIDDIVDERG